VTQAHCLTFSLFLLLDIDNIRVEQKADSLIIRLPDLQHTK